MSRRLQVNGLVLFYKAYKNCKKVERAISSKVPFHPTLKNSEMVLKYRTVLSELCRSPVTAYLQHMLHNSEHSRLMACIDQSCDFILLLSPHDVLATLLNNLKVQERQNRVCTTVAIAIVAETCSPFTVLPALMNEYRVPELNVQNGVLKSLSFLFEYIGEMGKDYIYAVTPLLEDALMDR